MKTSIKLLPAINTLYEFGITQKELNGLTKNWIVEWEKEDSDEEVIKPTFLEKAAEKIRKNLFVVLKKENDLIVAVPPASLHYEKENCIYLTRLSEDSKTHELLEKDTFYYGYQPDGGQGHIALRKNEMVFNKLGTNDLTDLAIIEIMRSVFRNEGQDVFPNATQKMESAGVYSGVTEVIEGMKNDLKSNWEIVNTKFDGNRYGTNISVKNLTQVLQYMYPDSLVTKGDFSGPIRKSVMANKKLKFIHTVVEVDNHRFAVNLYNQSHYGDSELTATMRIVPHTHECYNYVDVNRIWYGKANNYYSDNPVSFGRAMFINDKPTIPEYHVLDDYFKKVSEDEIKFLTNNDLNLIIKRFIQTENRLNAERVQREALDKKISDKLKQLTTDKGQLKINDVVYKKDSISYQGQLLKADDLTGNWVYEMLRRQTRGMDYQHITFDNMFDSFVTLTRRDHEYRSSVDKGTVGEVNFNITTKTSTNINNITSTRYYMNGHRINTQEIHNCVERAICYDNQEDYDHFLKSVSTCSLKMHRYLQLGIDVRVRDSFDMTEVVIKFPIERFKNLNYLVLNDEEYKIRDTQKLLRLERADDIMQVINVLLSGDVVMGIGPEDIKNVIDAGKQAYVDAIAKSKELLEHAENTLGVSEQHIELKDGTSFNGYIIEGKLRTYAVNARDQRHSVYDYDTAQYICIVDKSNAAQVGKDMLVNRLFALHNDSVVATKINTLNKRSTANG